MNSFSQNRALLRQLVRPAGKLNITFFPTLHCVFLGIHKCGNSTLNAMLLQKAGVNFDPSDYRDVHRRKKPYLITPREFRGLDTSGLFVFSFCRNPFARLVSVYEDKVLRKESHVITAGYPGGYFHRGMPFALFARRVCALPDALSDRHFVSQHRLIFPGGADKLDFLGKLESVSQDLETISKHIGPLPEISAKNVSQKKSDRLAEYYTPELLERVARRYSRDIDLLGYHQDHEKLRATLAGEAATMVADSQDSVA